MLEHFLCSAQWRFVSEAQIIVKIRVEFLSSGTIINSTDFICFYFIHIIIYFCCFMLLSLALALMFRPFYFI